MKRIVLLLSLMAFVSACKKEGEPAPGTTSNQDSVKQAAKASFQAVYDAFNSGNLAELDKHIAADYVEHTPFPGQEPGLDGLKKGMTDFRTAFPDLKFTMNDFWMDGDIAIAHSTQTGTMTGAMGNMPAPGKAMNVRGVDIVRLNKEGKAVEHWGYGEDMKMAQQLGWMPAPEAPPTGGGGGGTPKSKAPKGTPKSQPPTGKQKY